VIRKVVRRVYNTNEKRESDGESVTEAGAGVDGGGGVSVGGGVATGGEDAASSSAGAAAGPTGGKSKKRGKRSRQGHKAEKSEPGDAASKKQGKKSPPVSACDTTQTHPGRKNGLEASSIGQKKKARLKLSHLQTHGFYSKNNNAVTFFDFA
ncbi:hypothetical protein E3U43_012217, partial [Larimichthys crocea]